MKARHALGAPELVALFASFSLACGIGAETLETDSELTTYAPQLCVSNSDCGKAGYCRKDTCGVSLGLCVNPKECQDYSWLMPVCGCDGKTYQSACQAQLAGVSYTAGACYFAKTWLSNVSQCNGTTAYHGFLDHPVFWFVQPAAEEANHLALTKLTPAVGQYPFTVSSIRYRLRQRIAPPSRNTFKCNAYLGHEVLVFVGPANQDPNASPAILQTIAVAEESPLNAVRGSDFRELTHQLPQAITLQAGEALFVAVRMPYVDADNMQCIGSCVRQGSADRDYWSAAVDAPYPWPSLADYGIGEGYYVQAFGRGVQR